MALPVIEAPKYHLTIPSSGQTVEYRPFLVREEKILMIAQETNTQTAMERYIYHGKSAHRLSLSLLWAFLTLSGQLHHSVCQTNANALAVWPRTVYTISNINHRLSTCDGRITANQLWSY